MATIDQVIDIIPDAGHRGVDARTLFVTKQEAFQDAITDAFVPQLNTFRTEVNLLASEVNTLRDGTLTLRNETENIRNLANTQTQAQVALATAQAGIASTKASEASTSANQALTYKNQLQGYVVPAGASYSVEQINTQNSAMSKAQFLALCEERKANRAGSGFDNFGSNHSIYIGNNVNEGIFAPSAGDNHPNQIWLSMEGASTNKTSAGFPRILVGGYNQKLACIGAIFNKIQLPPAPTIYPHDTVLTPEQIASGVIKHADSSNSGLIVNGKFDTDTSGWQSSINFPAILSSVNGKLMVTATSIYGRAIQGFPTVVGKKYFIKGQKTLISGTAAVKINLTNNLGLDWIVDVDNIGEFTAIGTTTYIACGLAGSVSAGAVAEFDNISVYPADAISRSDLVFPESYHEDIAEKGVGYPFGNVQYLGGNTDGLTGIANGAFTGFETYSLFGFVY